MKVINKFLVINYKRFQELDEVDNTSDWSYNHPANKMLRKAITEWEEAYKNDTGKKLDQKYYVVNQDEPYANEILAIIEKYEDEKQN